MDNNLTPAQFKGGLGKWYKFPSKASPGDSPDYTPSLTYSRAMYHRPKLWRATRSFSRSDKPSLWTSILGHSGKMVAIKSSPPTDGFFVLKAEADALNRLQWISWIPTLRIAPRLFEYLKFDGQNSKQWFIAYEWLRYDQDVDEGIDWEPLSRILEKRALETAELLALHKALYRAVGLMHRWPVNIYHGDIKDEHILVKVVAQQEPSEIDDGHVYDFRTVRLIDFGLSYLKLVDEWKGASPGFCSPYFWDSSHRILDVNSMNALDWYCVDAILFYALSGECFPITSPAYSEIKNQQYFESVRDKLEGAHADRSDKARHAMASWLIKRLSAPNPTIIRTKDSFYQRQLSFISSNNAAAVWFLGILFGIGVLSQLFRVDGWLATGISICILLIIRLWRNSQFTVLDWYLDQQLESTSRPGWLHYVFPIVFGVFGIWILPLPLYAAVPACTGLLVYQKKSAWIPGVAIGVGGILAWMKLSINDFMYSGINMWPASLKTGSFAMLVILFCWLVGYFITMGRYQIIDMKKRVLLVLFATLFVWLLPLLVGKILLVPLNISSSFLIAGISSVGLSLTAALYAIWEYLIDVWL
jgi:hypothetical protein